MNFANIPLIRMPDVVGSLAQGYQAGLLPEMEKREQQKEVRAENADARAAEAAKLANAFKQMQMRYYPEIQNQIIAKQRLETDPQAKAKYAQDLINAFGGAAGQGGSFVTDDMKKQIIANVLGVKPVSQEQLAINKESRKLGREQEDEATSMKSTAREIKSLTDILDKPEFSTGWTSGLASSLGLGSQYAGAFNDIATSLQGKLARDLSERGSQLALKLAALGKPSMWSSKDYNKGIANQMRDLLKEAFIDLNNRHIRDTGHPLPDSLDDVLNAKKPENASQNQEENSRIMVNGKEFVVRNGKVYQKKG